MPRYFDVLADYSDADFRRLEEMLACLLHHPNSQLYPRQIPIAGADSKWLEARKGIISDLLATLQGGPTGGRDLYKRCGLRLPPQLIRIRVLDAELRTQLGGLGDITAPIEETAGLSIRPKHIFIVENLQSGLAFADLEGAVVIMRLGYGVDVLEWLLWLQSAQCIYWGDIDTHGFAILNRARTYHPDMKTVLMDEATLLQHRELWVEEKEQHPATELPWLTASEQKLYQSIKRNAWGQHIRLEQERIGWDVAWNAIQAIIR